MTNAYKPPLADILFALESVGDLRSVLTLDRYRNIELDEVHAVLTEVARLCAEVIAPTNRDGDTIGTRRHLDGRVTVPPSFVTAYRTWVQAGYGAMPFDPEHGGAGYPWSIALAAQEMVASANIALSLCPVLTQGAIDAIQAHGSARQKSTYLPKMLTGEWTGTMNLTEPQAGSDVGAVLTRAELVNESEGRWRITGQKIFITWGEHDMAENVIHLVLARTPGSPPGTRGISTFLVPKIIVNEDESLGGRNAVVCMSIENKLGIHGSPTCALSFDGAAGWLVGEEHDGMRIMFTMMNNARLSVGLEGVAIAERAYQLALAYARERVQGQPAGSTPGTTNPIVEHPDVRRMLMTQRAWIDAMRCLVYANAAALDNARAKTADAQKWLEVADVMIPLSKSLCTDVGSEMVSLALQVHGGIGYVETPEPLNTSAMPESHRSMKEQTASRPPISPFGS
ncbi:MAG: putative acyl-CoA dehydrogenase [Ilumatobacteraceae bacterium]|nr:putative acyl-CoA dehydrogenase [Ilumatobacteraceae bacterium]MCU1389733.1 putative acyl-CoA dehydrogenase [Ilumatobacteraceae bacterium]